MAKKRVDFSPQTKEIIAKRAAYRCSYPDCNATLIGPGLEPDAIENIGECAHIYAAAGKGPRSNDNLSDEDIQKPENGIFLCSKHHKLIDKHKGIRYPAETLMLYKQMHEHKISEELGHINYPLMWIKKVTVVESLILKEGLSYDFTKGTIITGTNGVGKSVLMEYIYTALTGRCVIRPEKSRVILEIEFSNPIWQKVRCEIDGGVVRYKVGEQNLTFCPFSVEVVYLRDHYGIVKGDLINWIGAQFCENREFVKNLIEGADLKYSYLISDIKMETVRRLPYEYVRIKLQKKSDLECDCHWVLEQLSSTEQYSVIIDLIVNYMRKASRYKNVLFLMDWSDINAFDSGLLSYYFKLFYDSSIYFQTVAAMHTLWQGVDWAGWNMITMSSEENLEIKWEKISKLENI